MNSSPHAHAPFRFPPLRAGLLTFAVLASVSCGPSDPVARVASRLSAVESARPFTLPDQTLVSHTGDPFYVRTATAGRLTLLFLGYTYCPDVCTRQMATANAVLGQLTEAERNRAMVLFVTVDPERDTPDRLAEWMEGMRAPAVGVRGSRAELEELLAGMGFAMPPVTSREPIEGGGPHAYLVPHPSSLFLVMPDGRGRFEYPYASTRPAEVAADLRTLMALDWPGAPESPSMAGVVVPGGLHEVSESTLGRTVAGVITIRDAHIPADPRARTLPVYAEIDNAGADDALVGFLTDIAEVGRVEAMVEQDGASSMQTTSELGLPTGTTLSLLPGQRQGSLRELLEVPSEGDTVEVIFLFESGAEIPVRVPVVDPDSRGPGA